MSRGGRSGDSARRCDSSGYYGSRLTGGRRHVSQLLLQQLLYCDVVGVFRGFR